MSGRENFMRISNGTKKNNERKRLTLLVAREIDWGPHSLYAAGTKENLWAFWKKNKSAVA